MSDNKEPTEKVLVDIEYLNFLVEHKELSTTIMKNDALINEKNERIIDQLKEIKATYEKIFDQQKIALERLKAETEGRKEKIEAITEVVGRLVSKLSEEDLDELGLKIEEIH